MYIKIFSTYALDTSTLHSNNCEFQKTKINSRVQPGFHSKLMEFPALC